VPSSQPSCFPIGVSAQRPIATPSSSPLSTPSAAAISSPSSTLVASTSLPQTASSAPPSANPSIEPALIPTGPVGTVWINEIHYDHFGTDVNEFIEIGHTTPITEYRIALYDGNPWAMSLYFETVIAAINPSGYTAFTFPFDFLQDGASTEAGFEGDGIAFVHPDGTVLEFLSYKGFFVAANGQAVGTTSTDIGVRESWYYANWVFITEMPEYTWNVWNGPLLNTVGRENAN
jgi:hypothetical protein